MTPADTNRNATVWPLADLFEALRREGFQLRPDDYLEVVQVLNAFQPQSHTDLQALIAPLIVTSDEEQQKFDRIFERIWQEERIEPYAVDQQPDLSKQKKPIPWGWLIAGLLALLAFSYIAVLWPGPSFRAAVQMAPESSVGPFEVGDTLVFAVDSSLRKAAGSLARWQWETPQGKPYPHPNEPTLRVVAQDPGPLVVNLRSQRGRGLLVTTWTDSLRGIENPICDKLPQIQLDSVRITNRAGNSSGRIRYRFKAHVTGSPAGMQLTQWRFDGNVVAKNQTEWEHTFQAGTAPVYHDVRFEAIPDTSQRLCFGEATLTVGVQTQREPLFTLDVRPTGALIVPKAQLDRRYYWALWVIGALLLLLIVYYGSMVIRDALTKDPEPPLPPDPDNPLARFVSDEPPLEIPLENREAELITRDQTFYQVVRTLRQPTEGELRRLHVPRTMQATMREGGFPTLIFQPNLTETEYLFLIDRSQIRSQQVALFEYVFRALVGENVCVERFFFYKTFDAFTNEKQLKGLTLRQLANTYRQHTLLIWSNGYPLLYPPYPVVEPAIREALTDWESRAILTPVPFADWGSKERALQADFLLLPADLVGQLRLMQALAEKQTRQDAYLRQQADELYSTEYVDFREVDELRDYLGDDRLQWLAAIALYPRIRWEVVIEMGRALMPPEVVNFTNLLKLARISWMHEGNFPDYTRLELLKALRPEKEAKARQTLLHMLRYAEQYFPGEHFYDGEKYLLQTVNQFTLYAYDADTFVGYQPAQEAFKKLYDKGLYPDGAMLHYLENSAGQWTTLLSPPKPQTAENQPQHTTLHSYLDNLKLFGEPAELVDQPVPRNPRRIYALAAILILILVLLGVWYLSSRPQNQVVDWDQPVPITIMLDSNTCVTARNTSVTDASNPARWTVFLNDSLYSISNLYATRSFALRDLIPGLADTSIYATLQATVSVNDTTAGGQRQYRTVAFNRDTLRVRIDCRKPTEIASNPKIPPTATVYIQYASRDQADAARQLQTRLGASGFTVPGIELRTSFRDSTQVRYFDDQERSEADSVAKIVKSLLKLRTVRVVKVDGRGKAPVEIWLNRGAVPQKFTCQAVPKSWVSQFNRWMATTRTPSKPQQVTKNTRFFLADATLTYTIEVSENGALSVNERDWDLQGKIVYTNNEAIGSIVRICQQKRIYLVQANANRAFIIQNVTRTSCNLALVNLNVSQLDSPQGQAYFNKLVQTANFRRYSPPEQLQSQTTNAEAAQQAAVPGNDDGSKANQTNQAAQVPVQSNTENLRIQVQNQKDAILQDGIRAYQRGQYDEAVKLYDQYLSKNYNDAYALDLKGYSLFKLKRYGEAANSLLAATKVDPKYAWAYFDLARVYCAMGRSLEANNARQQAITLQANMQRIMQNDKEFMDLCGMGGATAK